MTVDEATLVDVGDEKAYLVAVAVEHEPRLCVRVHGHDHIAV